MPYATIDMLVAKHGESMLVELTDRGDPPTGDIALTVVTQELANTDALIDGFLAGRYRLPLAAPVPPLLAPIAMAIAIYRLHVYSAPEKIEADYKAAIADLDRIAKGTIRLPGAEGVEPPSSGASGVQVTDRARPFTEQNLTGFI
jgi:phage gp36-like protein